jgi:hypothetical protein
MSLHAWLINDEGCIFDGHECLDNEKQAKQWAYNRGNSYRLVIDNGVKRDVYRVTNNRAVYKYSDSTLRRESYEPYYT